MSQLWTTTSKALLALAVTAAFVIGAEEPAQTPASVERFLRHHRQSFDQPDAAATYASLKRRPLDPEVDPAVALATARDQVKRMPVYASRLGGLLPGWSPPGTLGMLHAAFLRALATWEPLGPGNIGGRIRAFLVDPVEPETMYVGGVSGGVWKTTDGGGSWVPLTDLLANLAVCSLAMDPGDHRILYAGTGEGFYREEVRGTGLPLRGAGIFRTSDAGETWTQLAATSEEDFQWVNDLVTSPHDGDRLYAATRSGLWRSADAGASWEQVLDPQAHGGCLDLAVRTDTATDVVFAACGTLEGQTTVYRNLDAAGDGSWTAVLADPGMGRTSLAVAPSDQDVVYALAASNLGGPNGTYDQGLHALFRSTAGGEPGSWTARQRNTDPRRLETLLLTNPVAASMVQCGWDTVDSWVNMGWYANVIAVDPVDPDVVWVGGVDLFRSDDGGSSWGLASYWWLDSTFDTFVHADQHAIVFHPGYDGGTNRTLLVANDGGVFRTEDARATTARGNGAVCDPYAAGTSWTPLNHDLGVTQFYHGAPFPGGRRFLGGTQDNGTVVGDLVTGVNGWFGVLGGDGGYVAVDPTNPQYVYAEWQFFGFNRSTDGGLSFTDATSGISEPSSGFLFITPFVLDPNQPQRLWSGGRRLWRSSNRASSWQAASTYLSGGGSVSAIAVASGEPDRVLVGTSEGSLYRSDQALAAGASTVWNAVRPRQGFVSWVAFDPTDPLVAYATYAGFGGDHVWRSSDGGATWVALDGEGASALPDLPVHCLLVDPGAPHRLFLGTDLGVMVSPDRGATWALENSGFANVVTESLSLSTDSAGGESLFAFTHGRGAFRVELLPRTPQPRHPAGRIDPP